MSNFHKRFVSSTILLSLVFGGILWLPVWVFILATTLFITKALYEFYGMVRAGGAEVHVPIGLALGFSGCLLMGAYAHAEATESLTPLLQWAWHGFWPVALIVISVWRVLTGSIRHAAAAIANTLFGLLYIPGLMGYFFFIRTMDLEKGALWIIFLIIVTKVGDAGAYMVGKLWGRRPLTKISPKKTVEGVLGAFVFSALACLLAKPLLGLPVTTVEAVLLGLVLSLFGQLGDLVESIIKRDCSVKDASAFMPGLGGLLDVLDSLIFAAPAFYWTLKYVL